MKKFFAFGLSILITVLFSVPSFGYYISPEEIYDEPEESYDDGYEDGFEDGGGRIIYKTREVSAEEYIADHETRFRELYITFLLVLAICVAPILVFRYLIWREELDEFWAAALSVAYNLTAALVITYIMYRIDYLVPCMSSL